MKAIHDIRCKKCNTISLDVWIEDGRFPRCTCGGKTTWVPAKLVTFEWGQSRVFKSLDLEFASRSDFIKYKRENGVLDAGDPVGGARNCDGYKGDIYPKIDPRPQKPRLAQRTKVLRGANRDALSRSKSS